MLPCSLLGHSYSVLWLRLGLVASGSSTDAFWLHLWQRGTRPGILGFCQNYPAPLPQLQHVKVLSWGIWITFQKLPSVVKSIAASSNSLIYHPPFNFFFLGAGDQNPSLLHSIEKLAFLLQVSEVYTHQWPLHIIHIWTSVSFFFFLLSFLLYFLYEISKVYNILLQTYMHMFLK